MELDDLKTIWQQQSAKLVEKETVKESDLRDILRGKAVGLISKLIRSVRFEYYFTIVAMIVSAVIIPFTTHSMVKLSAVMILLLGAPFLFIYRRQLRTLRGIFPREENVKKALESIHGKFSQYVRFYRILYRAITPLALVVGLFMGGQAASGVDWYKVFNSPVVAILIVMVLLGFVYGMDKAIGLYLKRLYGDYLSHLEKVIKEFEEQ